MSTVVISGVSPGVAIPTTRAAQASGGAYSANYTSTSATLAGGATYTGTGVIPVGCKTVVATFFSDQASAANGAQLQVSADGTNWAIAAQSSLSAGSAVQLTASSLNNPLYYRLKYINGATPQAIFYGVITGFD